MHPFLDCLQHGSTPRVKEAKGHSPYSSAGPFILFSSFLLGVTGEQSIRLVSTDVSSCHMRMKAVRHSESVCESVMWTEARVLEVRRIGVLITFGDLLGLLYYCTVMLNEMQTHPHR